MTTIGGLRLNRFVSLSVNGRVKLSSRSISVQLADVDGRDGSGRSISMGSDGDDGVGGNSSERVIGVEGGLSTSNGGFVDLDDWFAISGGVDGVDGGWFC